MKFRTGIGYDVHQLVENRDLIIGGVKIPYEKGLKGHSDADVLLHAIGDALLGALALGDLGEHFPDNDPQFKGADSRFLLRSIYQKIKEKGYVVSNIDSVIIAEKPKLKPYREEMRKNITEDLGIDLNQISVKATTEEKMGFTGSGEGMAAWANVLLECRD
jgi:2-C-methyl-D-erythritol 2,4-cyclodiphosphate synthase